MEPGGADTVLEPAADGAVPLVLTTHTPVDSDHIVTVTVAAGDPAVTLAELPDCGCDGCDSGSAALLEEMDRWVLSVVAGSLRVDVTADRSSIRSSFGGHGGTVQHLEEAMSFSAAPWPADWTARPIPPEIGHRHPEAAFPRTMLDRLLRRDGPPGSAQRYRSR